MRLALERARTYERDFDEAWDSCFGLVRWPHDTTHRREWKAILADERTKAVWRSAYYKTEAPSRQRAVGRIAA
jgi:hypothetical protein